MACASPETMCLELGCCRDDVFCKGLERCHIIHIRHIEYRVREAHRSESLVRAALDRRKSAWRQALLMGVGTLLKLAVGRLSLPDAERVATRIFQVRGRAVVAPYAAIGMDVDKPFQYDIVRQRMG